MFLFSDVTDNIPFRSVFSISNFNSPIYQCHTISCRLLKSIFSICITFIYSMYVSMCVCTYIVEIYTHIHTYNSTCNYTFLVFYDIFSVECLFPKVLFIEYDPSDLLFEEGSGIQHSRKNRLFHLS